MNNILVVGSLNIDFVMNVPCLPKPGETLLSTKFCKHPGGKGANQAVAAAKLGAEVRMIGKVGADEYGDILLESLRLAGVSTDGVAQEGVTGMACITVGENAENHIVIVPGANATLDKRDIDRISGMIQASDWIVMQLEVPLEVVGYCLEKAAMYEKPVILNPAPALILPPAMLKHVHTLIPNETELQTLTGMPTESDEEVERAARHMQTRGVRRIVVTRGAKGAYLLNEHTQYFVSAYPVDAVDTTAAGDSFVAGFAVAKGRGLSDLEALEYANKVAAITVTREGAQPSLPTKDEVDRILNRRGE
ncbi:ribokinase [Paenibacillus sp. J2TS4]|uniref:ribokinase n=1 Tax=Paenibacillus sp. J2TS4 TaxID=2807194 RepID=UPI0020BE4FE4|nr:ribokinase [Paenibacillus sp. J2TS4]